MGDGWSWGKSSREKKSHEPKETEKILEEKTETDDVSPIDTSNKDLKNEEKGDGIAEGRAFGLGKKLCALGIGFGVSRRILTT